MVGKIPWRRDDPLEKGMAPTPVLWPGKPHRQRTWRTTAHGASESDPTEGLGTAQHTLLIIKIPADAISKIQVSYVKLQ